MAATLLVADSEQFATYLTGVHTYTITQPLDAYGAPIGWATGDTIVVALALQSPADGSGGLPATPAGWTPLSTIDLDCGGGNRYRLAMYSRVRQSGDASTYTFTATTATAQDVDAKAFVFVGRGVKGIRDVFAASTLVSISAPHSPLNNVGLIPAKVTSTGDIAGCFLFKCNIPTASGTLEVSRENYSSGLPDISTASIAQLPVAYDAFESNFATAGESGVAAFRFNLVAKRNSGGFGASTI